MTILPRQTSGTCHTDDQWEKRTHSIVVYRLYPIKKNKIKKKKTKTKIKKLTRVSTNINQGGERAKGNRAKEQL